MTPDLVERLFHFAYAAICAGLAIGIALVGFAYRAGGDVREIKNAIKDYGPRIAENEKFDRAIDLRVTALEVKTKTR